MFFAGNKFIIIPFLLALIFTGCNKENTGNTYVQDSNVFQDVYGRTLIFHGKFIHQ